MEYQIPPQRCPAVWGIVWSIRHVSFPCFRGLWQTWWGRDPFPGRFIPGSWISILHYIDTAPGTRCANPIGAWYSCILVCVVLVVSKHMRHIFISVNLVVAVHAQPPIYTGRQDDRPWTSPHPNRKSLPAHKCPVHRIDWDSPSNARRLFSEWCKYNSLLNQPISNEPSLEFWD